MKMKPEYLLKAFEWAQPVALVASYIFGNPTNSWYEFGVGFTLFCWIAERAFKWFLKKND